MLITIEGPDGSGKSSQIGPLADFLRRNGYPVVETREPGGTFIGNQIRDTVLGVKNTAMHPRSEILLFQASRAQLVEEVIRPAIKKGKVVLCDRYADSTMAYQGYGHEQDLVALRNIVEYATGGLKPDLTLLLDIDAKEGLKRRSGDNGTWNRLDAYDVEFHRRVRAGYHEMVKAEPERWVVIDGGKPFEEVQGEIREAIMSRLGSHA